MRRELAGGRPERLIGESRVTPPELRVQETTGESRARGGRGASGVDTDSRVTVPGLKGSNHSPSSTSP